MKQFMTYLGQGAGVAGALICLVAGLARLTGVYHMAAFEATTLFMVGTGLMVFACMVKLELLLGRS
ncbi:hypothetical protein DWB85_17910 [Seongchinamella sediminis]|uniref:Uncharacterized protein n=1 Tax=Seongchinamella sediminis TaxID=2283635 RepID=A0A3L7DX46_9GAMM|nr:hypothetical protein [Seongchinamella sediminis]RLQ20372.1 hypothetical protein DWB85_17910 [Seongchinamella sediminis]